MDLFLLDERAMELERLIKRVEDEFNEMPGLRLTLHQATRLWGIERDLCRAIIDRLVEASILRWTAAGAVARVEN
jgi:hypothetical protein